MGIIFQWSTSGVRYTPVTFSIIMLDHTLCQQWWCMLLEPRLHFGDVCPGWLRKTRGGQRVTGYLFIFCSVCRGLVKRNSEDAVWEWGCIMLFLFFRAWMEKVFKLFGSWLDKSWFLRRLFLVIIGSPLKLLKQMINIRTLRGSGCLEQQLI